MNDQTSDTDKLNAQGIVLPPGVELTPEATRLLNRQLSRNIVWGYWSSKGVLALFGVLAFGVAAFFLWASVMGGSNVLNLRVLLNLLLYVGVPCAIGALLFRAAVKY